MQEIMKCERCNLAKTRRLLVAGKGSIPADILFLGEAPGKTEDLLGEPFIGQSGKLLDAMLLDAGFGSTKYFVTNSVLCRPCDSIGGDSREPAEVEVLTCKENILQIYFRVNPKVVIFVGKIAEKYYKNEFPFSFSILHPSFVLRQGGKASPWYLNNVRKLQEVLKAL